VNAVHPLVAVDVGNSAVKVALVPAELKLESAGTLRSQDVLQRTFPIRQAGWMSAVCDWVAAQTDPSEAIWWVSTVNRTASRPLRDLVSNRFPNAEWRVVDHETVPIVIEVDFPERLGIDRLVGAYAAALRFPTPVAVVDAGSAVTVDWVVPGPAQDSVFTGGAILPGIRLQLDALATGTEAIEGSHVDLPSDTEVSTEQHQAITPRPTPFHPAKNTEDAIKLGIIAAVAGGVERLVQDYALATNLASEQATPRMILTGGDAPRLSQCLRRPHQFAPHLVCLGLFDLAIKHCQVTSAGLE
jgi:type III pantothenate kinase